MKTVDRLIIGGGIYGLYAALFCAKRGQSVIVLEYDDAAFSRASYVNQARVHNGYHYPRSYSTAIKSVEYYNRFVEDFGFCIYKDFTKIYATGTALSWVNQRQYKKFCDSAKIKCDPINMDTYFKEGMCSGAYESDEFTFDAELLKNHFLQELKNLPNVEIIYQSRIEKIEKTESKYLLKLLGGLNIETGFILNATYGSINQILNKMDYELFDIKYELCEMILCEVSDNLKNVGITLMDGPFFSLMPFGKTGLHSLSAVQYTPHKTSHDSLPTFDCQEPAVKCSKEQLGNCNICPNKPQTAWPNMVNLAKKYLNDDIDIKYIKSIFAIKSILNTSEIDDSRPTIIKKYSDEPVFYSVLSGKINTIYDIDEILL